MTLLLGLLFGAVGTVYLYIARKDHDPLYLIVGFLLIAYPYVFDSAVWIIIIGVALSVIPYLHYRGVF